MLKRKIEKDIMRWIESSDKALLIYGVRQAGKTYIVRECLKAAGCDYIEFNLIRQPEIVEILDGATGIDDLILKLSLYSDKKIVPGKTFFFFDEIQRYKEIVTKIKFLVDDKRFRYIMSGSLLGVEIVNLKSAPVGYLQTLNMYPLDFEEFLWANGNDTMMDFIRDCYRKKAPLGQALHRKAMDLFRQYLIVGGMPQAVNAFVKHNDFDEVDRVKRRILNLYRDDIRKHAKGYEMKVEAIYDEIPSQMKNQNQHFKLSSLKQGARFDEYKDAMFWLSDAMIVNHCYNATEPTFGLNLNRDRTLLKCYMGDTGLLISHAFDENGIVTGEVYKKLLLDKLEVNMGMVMENMVAQMLTASGHKLYFYSNSSRSDASSRMEIDFLIAKSQISNRHNISPIEVKSSKNYTLSSLKKFKTKYAEQLHIPYVLHTGDFKEEDGIVFLPLYMTPLL